MSRRTYKTVFIDFYGTVVGGDAEVVERTCARLVAEHNPGISSRRLAIAWGERFFATIDACRVNGYRTLYRCECDSLVETCMPLCGEIDPVPYVDQLFDYMRSPSLHPETVDVLGALNVPSCCVSNADREHLHTAIARRALEFDAVVCSEDVRSYKPEPAIFERAMDTMRCQPDEVIHIGDSLHSDVGGARRAGIDTVWLCRDRRIHDIGDADPDYKIGSLKELKSILT